MPWVGPALGVIVGIGSEEGANVGGGASKNANNDPEAKNGGGGYFSFIRGIWGYVGGILGFGDRFGLYLTAGGMAGYVREEGFDADFGVGAGIHFAKAVGLGVIVPIKRTIQAINRNNDKLSAIVDQTQYYASVAADHLYQVGSGVLETIVNNPLT